MDLANLPKITKRSAKRVGRGYGSGRGGHTSGRGSKGQKARGKIRVGFEGTKAKKSLVKRLPLLRGKGKFKPLKGKFLPLNLSDLSDWPAKLPVTTENLARRGRGGATKILARGDIEQALVIKVPISQAAAKKILKAGGKIDKI